MGTYCIDGTVLRDKIKDLVMNYILTAPACDKHAEGMRTAEIFRECGLDWGGQENATSAQQQYWLVALLRVLENEGRIIRDPVTKKWRRI